MLGSLWIHFILPSVVLKVGCGDREQGVLLLLIAVVDLEQVVNRPSNIFLASIFGLLGCGRTSGQTPHSSKGGTSPPPF